VLRSAQRRADDETRERLAWAWYVAALVRSKGRLPSLASVLAPTSETPSIDKSRADHAALVAAAKDN
jgi:hypothetical protein